MLVLSRKQNEGVLVDGRIEIQILSVQGSRVKLGIKAPKEVQIVRNEISAHTHPPGAIGLSPSPPGNSPPYHSPPTPAPQPGV